MYVCMVCTKWIIGSVPLQKIVKFEVVLVSMDILLRLFLYSFFYSTLEVEEKLNVVDKFFREKVYNYMI